LSSGLEKTDKRILRTLKLLNMAMYSLLKKDNLNNITVRKILDESLVGRATFYSNFKDKYDFLKFWLSDFCPHDVIKNNTYEDVEKIVNQFVRENETIIKNILIGADNRTLRALSEFLLTTLKDTDKQNSKCHALSNFYSGGILQYFIWQAENNFPQDVKIMNEHLYNFIIMFQRLE